MEKEKHECFNCNGKGIVDSSYNEFGEVCQICGGSGNVEY
jgi:DnaJ-class molecular chaperone